MSQSRQKSKPTANTDTDNDEKKTKCVARDGSDLQCGAETEQDHTWCSKHFRRFSKLISTYKTLEAEFITDPYMSVNGDARSLEKISALLPEDIAQEFSRVYKSYLLRSKVNQLGFLYPDEGHQYRCDIMLQYLEILEGEMGKRKLEELEVEYVTYDYVEKSGIISEVPKKQRATVAKIRNNVLPPYELTGEKLRYKVLYEVALARIKSLIPKLGLDLFLTAYSLQWNYCAIANCRLRYGERNIIDTFTEDAVYSGLKMLDNKLLSKVHIILDAIEKEFGYSVALLELQKSGLSYINNIFTDIGYVMSGLISISNTIDQLDDIQEAATYRHRYTGIKKGYKRLAVYDIKFSELNPNMALTPRILAYFDNPSNKTYDIVTVVSDITADEEYVAAYLDGLPIVSDLAKNLVTINLDQLAANKRIRFNRDRVINDFEEHNRRHFSGMTIYPGKISPTLCDLTTIRSLMWDREKIINEQGTTSVAKNNHKSGAKKNAKKGGKK